MGIIFLLIQLVWITLFSNDIFKVILPIRLLLLRRTDSFKYELLSRLMGHEEEIKNYPTYWNRVRDTLGPLILDILNNKQLINEDKNDKLTIENVVRMKKIMSKITIVKSYVKINSFYLNIFFEIDSCV